MKKFALMALAVFFVFALTAMTVSTTAATMTDQLQAQALSVTAPMDETTIMTITGPGPVAAVMDEASIEGSFTPGASDQDTMTSTIATMSANTGALGMITATFFSYGDPRVYHTIMPRAAAV